MAVLAPSYSFARGCETFRRGHLSNDDSGLLVGRCGKNRPGWIAMAHLSEDNNRPALAVEALREAVGQDYLVYHASRYGCSEMLRV